MQSIRRSRRTAFVLALTLALVAAACVPGGGGPGGPPTALRILSPTNGTQLPAGTVDVQIEIDAPLAPSTLQVVLENLEHGTTDVTGSFTFAGRTASATLGATQLREGYTKLVATARPKGEAKGARARAAAAFSWEPRIQVDTRRGCEFLAPKRCLLPFPSDYFTQADPTSATGRRVRLVRAGLPANPAGVHIDPTEWNRNDGFSPGTAALVHVPGVDVAQSGLPPIIDLEQSLGASSASVIVDAATGARHLHWAELDANAPNDDVRGLFLRPGVNFEESHRYVIALRHLRDASGALLDAPRAFEVYRDNVPTFIPAVEGRRPRMESLFATLAGAGVDRGELYLAWDFTIASARNLSERLLHIRDDAFASLAGAAPGFTVTNVEENVNEQIFRRVTGTFVVPKYLTGTGAPGSRFDYGGSTAKDALPVRGGTVTAPFICNIPRATTVDGDDPVTPARGVVYGHGLLGSHSEVNSSGQRNMANEHNMVYCATDWAGMSELDLGNVVTILGDLSNFPTMADRLQQGILNTLFLGRLLKDPNGFASNAAFHAGAAATPVLVPNQVFYDGNSQGGILGGAATAVSTEWTRAVLGVPAMNYSLLLRRSVDFDPFSALLAPVYPDPLDQAFILQFIQMLWDRGEANGYAHHMTDDPYPGTPAHQVLLHEAFGDHQVANVATEIEARTIGAHLLMPALAAGRHSDVDPFFGVPIVPSLPFGGSGFVVWDSGTPTPPTENVPPRPPDFGTDPHGRPRAQVSARVQKSEFLRVGGTLIDVCGGAPCLAP
jgi:hypothetical protein